MTTKATEKRLAVSKSVRDRLNKIRKENKLDKVNTVLELLLSKFEKEIKKESSQIIQ